MKFYTLLILFNLSFLSGHLAMASTSNLDNLPQTNNLVKAGKKSVTLLGTQVNIGELAPNFKVVDKNFTPVELSNFTGKTILISVVPSLDTGVCSLQTKRFNEEVSNLPDDVIMLTISNDLPFAQKRFCKLEKVDNLKVLSDSVWRDFGSKYGLLIKDMGLLTRSIFIINNQGEIAYKELVANISNHPDYDSALSALRTLVVPEKQLIEKNKTDTRDDQLVNIKNKRLKTKI